MELTDLAKLIIERWGAAGAIIVALVIFAWRLNGQINKLREQAIQGQIGALQKTIGDLELKMKAVSRTLVEAGLWHPGVPRGGERR